MNFSDSRNTSMVSIKKVAKEYPPAFKNIAMAIPYNRILYPSSYLMAGPVEEFSDLSFFAVKRIQCI